MGGRLIARISTERCEYAPEASVSDNYEYEKRGTASPIHFHIHLHTPNFLHRHPHLDNLHANRKNAASRIGLVCHPRGDTETTEHERWGPRAREWQQREWKLATPRTTNCLEAPTPAKSGGDGLSRTKRLREEVHIFLAERGRANTVEVFDHLNERFSWGATMNQVGNILAKDIRFEKVGSVRDFFRGARYSVCLWALSGRNHSGSGPTKATA